MMIPTLSAIVKEDREAMKALRKKWCDDPEEARRFLIHAGILTKDGRKLA